MINPHTRPPAKQGGRGENNPKRARKMGEDEEIEADVIAEIPPEPYYGYIESIEDEWWGGALIRQHITIECISSRWFDGCYMQRHFPDVDTMAAYSRIRHIEIVAAPNVVADANNFLGAIDFGGRGQVPHLHQGHWVGVLLHPDRGIPCIVYLPAQGSNDPATIGLTPNEYTACAMLQRLNPMRLGELRWFSDVFDN